MSMTLKIEEIRDLAEFCGFVLKDRTISEDDMGSEIIVSDCPEDGVKDEDGNKVWHCDHIAHYAEYPEEGCIPLGNATPNAWLDRNEEARP